MRTEQVLTGKWVLWAGAVGLASSAVFSSILGLERGPFVLAHTLTVAAFWWVFSRRTTLDLSGEFRHRPIAGSLAGLAVGLLLALSVLRLPGGHAPRGSSLAVSLGWYGFVYGVADALLLTMVPVLAVMGGAAVCAGEGRGSRRALRALAGLLASLFVTALYHLGFDEFRGLSLTQPLVGNAIITAGYLVTRNPVTPLLSHSLMHVAAVLHGMETASQLPPHY